MDPDINMADWDTSTHQNYMQLVLDEARRSPPKPTNFCVGAALVCHSLQPELLVTGYTLECEGNTHAEQCCFIKLAIRYGCSEEDLGHHIPKGTVLYTTMEPCNKRSAGNMPCVDRILRLMRKEDKQAIERVYVGVSEPETFVGVNEGKKKLQDAGIEVIHVPGLEEEMLKVATAGHPKGGEKHDDS